MDAGIARYRRLASQALDRGEAAALKPAERLLVHWVPRVIKAIEDDKASVLAGESDTGRNVYGPMFLALDTEKLAVMALSHSISLCLRHPIGVRVAHLTYTIGASCAAEAAMELIKSDRDKYSDGLRLLTERVKRLTPRKINHWANKNLDNPVWHRRVCAHVGTRLMWHIISCCSANPGNEEFSLAFHHFRKRSMANKKAPAMLSLDDSIHAIVSEGHAFRELLSPVCGAMVIPPNEWSKGKSGGYLTLANSPVIKCSGRQREMLREADLSPIHEAINAVNSTGWRIDKYILEVAKELVYAGGNVAGIPQWFDKEFPPKPADIDTNPEAKKAWKKLAARVRSENVRLRSDRVEVYMKMDAAEKDQDFDVLYMPHEMDYRGRSYPRGVNLNHQQDDLARGLLRFAEPRWIDDQESMDRVLVHGANSAGFDKASFDERAEWFYELSYKMQPQDWDVKSATDSLGVWASGEVENPFQTLAACHAVWKPSRADTLPVQIDCTANGLQHYAAITLDESLAEMVNLAPGDRPSDGYSILGRGVEAIIRSDAHAGNQWAIDFLGHIAVNDPAKVAKAMRKISKRPMMTKTYQVTRVGAREQIADELKGMGYGQDQKVLYAVSKYLADVVLRSLASMAPAAHRAMDWLADCARAASAAGYPVRWVTDDGFPVEQPYRNHRRMEIDTCVQKVILIDPGEDVPVNKKKQVSAFAANYIHSLDATHCRMIARRCRAEGVTFAHVHDSFWTHAATVRHLDRIIREEFVKLHETNALGRLRDQFLKLYPGIKFPQVPDRGRFSLGKVIDSTYFAH